MQLPQDAAMEGIFKIQRLLNKMNELDDYKTKEQEAMQKKMSEIASILPQYFTRPEDSELFKIRFASQALDGKDPDKRDEERRKLLQNLDSLDPLQAYALSKGLMAFVSPNTFFTLAEDEPIIPMITYEFLSYRSPGLKVKNTFRQSDLELLFEEAQVVPAEEVEAKKAALAQNQQSLKSKISHQPKEKSPNILLQRKQMNLKQKPNIEYELEKKSEVILTRIDNEKRKAEESKQLEADRYKFMSSFVHKYTPLQNLPRYLAERAVKKVTQLPEFKKDIKIRQHGVLYDDSDEEAKPKEKEVEKQSKNKLDNPKSKSISRIKVKEVKSKQNPSTQLQNNKITTQLEDTRLNNDGENKIVHPDDDESKKVVGPLFEGEKRWFEGKFDKETENILKDLFKAMNQSSVKQPIRFEEVPEVDFHLSPRNQHDDNILHQEDLPQLRTIAKLEKYLHIEKENSALLAKDRKTIIQREKEKTAFENTQDNTHGDNATLQNNAEVEEIDSGVFKSLSSISSIHSSEQEMGYYERHEYRKKKLEAEEERRLKFEEQRKAQLASKLLHPNNSEPKPVEPENESQIFNYLDPYKYNTDKNANGNPLTNISSDHKPTSINSEFSLFQKSASLEKDQLPDRDEEKSPEQATPPPEPPKKPDPVILDFPVEIETPFAPTHTELLVYQKKWIQFSVGREGERLVVLVEIFRRPRKRYNANLNPIGQAGEVSSYGTTSVLPNNVSVNTEGKPESSEQGHSVKPLLNPCTMFPGKVPLRKFKFRFKALYQFDRILSSPTNPSTEFYLCLKLPLPKNTFTDVYQLNILHGGSKIVLNTKVPISTPLAILPSNSILFTLSSNSLHSLPLSNLSDFDGKGIVNIDADCGRRGAVCLHGNGLYAFYSRDAYGLKLDPNTGNIIKEAQDLFHRGGMVRDATTLGKHLLIYATNPSLTYDIHHTVYVIPTNLKPAIDRTIIEMEEEHADTTFSNRLFFKGQEFIMLTLRNPSTPHSYCHFLLTFFQKRLHRIPVSGHTLSSSDYFTLYPDIHTPTHTRLINYYQRIHGGIVGEGEGIRMLF